MDKHTGIPLYTNSPRSTAGQAPQPSVLPETQDFSAYALFPDAGDFAGLEEAAPPPEPAAAPVRPEPVPTPVIPGKPSVPPPQTARIPQPATAQPQSPLRHLLRLVFAVWILSALFVYGNMLLTGGASLLSEGLGKLAVSGVFGTGKEVTLLPQSEESRPSPPVWETETSPVPQETAMPAKEDPVPAPLSNVIDRSLASAAPHGLGLINETPYTPDLTALAARTPVIDTYASLESIYGKGTPAVLILHTHSTEAFRDQAENGYHTDDRAKNICTVGEALAETLREVGIGVLHCTELFDVESFDMAYYNAARYIRQTLKEHPSIRYILDIHRDAITTEDGTGIRPLSVQDNTAYAQLMFVVGTDHGGSGHTDWETNLSLAARLQSALHGENPTLMRDINLRSASFNAQYAPGALLVEAGAACSTLEEAVRSIRVFGETLAAEILGE